MKLKRSPPLLAARRTALALAVLVMVTGVGGGQQPEGERYGETPETLLPYRAAGEPYATFFVDPPQFRGPGREQPEPEVEDVAIGVLAPASGPDAGAGRRMLQGIELAVDEANSAGGYRPGVPFRLIVRDESQAWGASANAAVELVFGQGVWALIGAMEDNASHVMSRLLLKIETPLVNTNGSDPTLTEHAVPWMIRLRPDDRRTSYRLAAKIFTEDRRERVVVFRANNRYARVGVVELVDAARRLHRPILLEVRFEDDDREWGTQIERIRSAQPDAIVLWGRPGQTGRVLAAVRAAGLDQPAYGPDRLVDRQFLEAAGPAAEGLVATYPFDPDRRDAPWRRFSELYFSRYGEAPDAAAAYGYDGARYLLEAIREAGLNRVRIRDRMFARSVFRGVSGSVRFDSTHNNVAAVVLCRVEEGAFRLLEGRGGAVGSER